MMFIFISIFFRNCQYFRFLDVLNLDFALTGLDFED